MTTTWEQGKVCAEDGCMQKISDQAQKCKSHAKPRKRAVTDGEQVFDSIGEAAGANEITPAAIIYRIRSKSRKWIGWSYVNEMVKNE